MKQIKFLIYIIITFLLITTISSSVNALTCQEQNIDVCGSSPDSSLGFGAIEICNNCYPCGVSDSVCPEDFYDSSKELQASCLYCPDPDCHSSLNVSVFDDFGSPYPGATVDITYDQSTVASHSGVTDGNGKKSFPDIPSGHVTVMVSDPGSEMIALSKEANLTRGETTILVFNNFSQAECESDCTRGDGFCHEDCIGINGCSISGPLYNFTELELAQSCSLKHNGSSAFLGQNENKIYFANCCSGPVIETIRPKININDFQKLDNKIFGLVNHVQGALFNSEQIFMVSTYWKSN